MESWLIPALAATLGFGIQTHLLRQAAREGYNSIRVNAAFMLTVAVIAGMFHLLTASGVSGFYFMLFAAGSGLAYLFASICRIESFKYSPSQVAAPITALYIALTPMMAYVIFRERITPAQLAGLTLATFAVVTLSREITRDATQKKQVALGIVFAAAAATSTSFNNVLGKSAAITGDIMSFILFAHLFSFLLALGMQRFVNKDMNPLKHLVKDYNATRLGIIIGIITFFSYYALLKSLMTGKAMVIFPITGTGIAVAVLISAWAYKEKLTRRRIAGIATALLAVALLSNLLELG